MRQNHFTNSRAFFSAIVIASLFAITAQAGAPLKGIDIKLGKNPGGTPMYSARTDEDGKFTFPKLPPGVYSLYISYDQVNEFAIKENGVKKYAIKENGVKKSTSDDASGIAIGDPGVNGNLTTPGDSGAAQKKWLPANFRLELEGEDDVTVAVQGETTAKRQHSAITITKEWGSTTSRVTITVTETATVKGKLTIDREK